MNLAVGKTWNSSLEVIASVYSPGPWAVEQIPVPMSLVPGSCCIECSLGTCMYGLMRRDIANACDQCDGRGYYWEPFVVPIVYNEYDSNFRAPTWGRLEGGGDFLLNGEVEFKPDQLVYSAVQHSKLPRGPGSGAYWGGCCDLYSQWGLVSGQKYRVEHVFDEPFIKVRDVPIVMCAEVWDFQR